MNKISFNSDLWGALCLVVFGGLFYFLAGDLPEEAAVWPRLILAFMIALSAMLAWSSLHNVKAAEQVKRGIAKHSALAVSVVAAAVILYAAAIECVGFFSSTALFMPLSMFALGQRSRPVIFLTTAGLELFIYLLFVMQLQVRMP